MLFYPSLKVGLYLNCLSSSGFMKNVDEMLIIKSLYIFE